MIDVKQLSKLVRIKLDAGEEKRLQKEFEDILGYVSKLKRVDLSALASDKDILEKARNAVREDNKAHEKGEFSKEMMKEVPSVERGYVKVKHVFE
jgi:aspartyl/glutamyl-tRNA(Asn/Gln) amidotransferase C subunit